MTSVAALPTPGVFLSFCPSWRTSVAASPTFGVTLSSAAGAAGSGSAFAAGGGASAVQQRTRSPTMQSLRFWVFIYAPSPWHSAEQLLHAHPAWAVVTGSTPNLLKYNALWRRGWDSNPRYGYPYDGFRDRALSKDLRKSRRSPAVTEPKESHDQGANNAGCEPPQPIFKRVFATRAQYVLE